MQQGSKPKSLSNFRHKVTGLLREKFGFARRNNSGIRGSAWDTLLDIAPDELQKLYDRLVANTDALSHEVAVRFIARQLFRAQIESWGLGYKFEIRHHSPSTPDWEFVLMAYC